MMLFHVTHTPQTPARPAGPQPASQCGALPGMGPPIQARWDKHTKPPGWLAAAQASWTVWKCINIQIPTLQDIIHTIQHLHEVSMYLTKAL